MSEEWEKKVVELRGENESVRLELEDTRAELLSVNLRHQALLKREQQSAMTKERMSLHNQQLAGQLDALTRTHRQLETTNRDLNTQHKACLLQLKDLTHQLSRERHKVAVLTVRMEERRCERCPELDLNTWTHNTHPSQRDPSSSSPDSILPSPPSPSLNSSEPLFPSPGGSGHPPRSTPYPSFTHPHPTQSKKSKGSEGGGASGGSGAFKRLRSSTILYDSSEGSVSVEVGGGGGGGTRESRSYSPVAASLGRMTVSMSAEEEEEGEEGGIGGGVTRISQSGIGSDESAWRSASELGEEEGGRSPYGLVRLSPVNGRGSAKHYVVEVLGVRDGGGRSRIYKVIFLKKYSGQEMAFVRGEGEDEYEVDGEEILHFLPLPRSDRRGKLIFPFDFSLFLLG